MVSMVTHYAILKTGSVAVKNIHISAASHSRTLNLVSSYFSGKARLQDCWICKLSHLNIHECKKTLEINEKSQKNQGVVLTKLLISYLIIAL